MGFAALPAPVAHRDSGWLKWPGEDGEEGAGRAPSTSQTLPGGLAGGRALRKPPHGASCQRRGQVRELRAGRGVMKEHRQVRAEAQLGGSQGLAM